MSKVRRKLQKVVRRLTGKGQAAGVEPYAPVLPHATYSPWNTDADFKAAWRRVKSHTLVDRLRGFELWKLVGQTASLEGSLMEIGVWRGGSGTLIAMRAKACGIEAPVYLCDTFKGVVKAGAHDPLYRNGEHADTSRVQVETLVREAGLDRVRILEGIFPDDTAHAIAPDEKFRFCHIDVDVYQSAADIVAWLWGRLVVGGMIVYDDYGFAGCEGIARHVEEQLGPDRVVVHNLNGHAVVIKTR